MAPDRRHALSQSYEGITGAHDKFHLAAVVQNIKTLANRNQRPPSTLTERRSRHVHIQLATSTTPHLKSITAEQAPFGDFIKDIDPKETWRRPWSATRALERPEQNGMLWRSL